MQLDEQEQRLRYHGRLEQEDGSFGHTYDGTPVEFGQEIDLKTGGLQSSL